MAAVRIIKKAAHAVDRISSALIKMQANPSEPLPCALFGGIAPFIEPWLGEDLRSILVPREADANAGAILMIRQCVAEQS